MSSQLPTSNSNSAQPLSASSRPGDTRLPAGASWLHAQGHRPGTNSRSRRRCGPSRSLAKWSMMRVRSAAIVSRLALPEIAHESMPTVGTCCAALPHLAVDVAPTAVTRQHDGHGVVAGRRGKHRQRQICQRIAGGRGRARTYSTAAVKASSPAAATGRCQIPGRSNRRHGPAPPDPHPACRRR